MKIAAMIGGALLLMAPASVLAAAKEVKQLRSSDEVTLSPDKAYFLYDTEEKKYDIYFLRSLTTAELAQFEEKRAAALAEERERLRAKRDGAPGVSDEELLPESAFSFVDEEINNLIRFDSGRVFAKDGQKRTYIAQVPPGEYTVFAAGLDGFTSGTCMCMGTVSFDAKGGVVTDLGTILIAPEDGKSKIPELSGIEAPEYIRRKALPYVMSVRPAEAGDAVPEAVVADAVAPASYRTADKIPNFMGMLINRMLPIDGILAYDGDRPIDVNGARPVTAAGSISTTGEAPEGSDGAEGGAD